MADFFTSKGLTAASTGRRFQPTQRPVAGADPVPAESQQARLAGSRPPPEDVHIRPMVPPDLAAYKTLRDLMLAAHPEAFSSDADTELRRPPETYLARVAGAADGGWPFTITAWRGDWLCGAVTCERDPRVKVRHIGHLVGMMVHPAACGRGVGHALIGACIAQCVRRGGIDLLTLSVTSGSAAAIRLYERNGFVRYGRLERAVRIGPRFHHKDLMMRTLESKT